MDTLIDVLQHKIPEIERLSQGSDLKALLDKTRAVALKIDDHRPETYGEEKEVLLELSAYMDELLKPGKDKKITGAFEKTKSRVLLILNTVLEMED